MVQGFKLLTTREADDDLSSAFDTLFGNPSQTRMDALDESFKVSGGRQGVFKPGLSVSKVDARTAQSYGQPYASILTGMGVHGVRFTYVGTGATGEQVGNGVDPPEFADKVFYLSIRFDGEGGHAIGINAADPRICFDPSPVEHLHDSGDAVDFFTLLWSRISGIVNGGIQKPYLYEMKVAESRRDFRERKSKA